MTDIERARRQLSISGYVHPKSPKGKSSRYKTLDTETSGTDYRSSVARSSYATFTERDNARDNARDASLCPVCETEAEFVCNCAGKCRECGNGHVWYSDKSGHIVQGDPHKNDSDDSR